VDAVLVVDLAQLKCHSMLLVCSHIGLWHRNHGSNRVRLSSRIRPANDRETLRNDGNGWSIEAAGQSADLVISAGSEIGSENPLKEEWLFVVIPAGEVGGNGRISSASLR
jgi:hypothetical protein